MAETTKKEESNETIPLLGDKYIYTVGRRKSAVAQVRVYENGKGLIYINGKEFKAFFPTDVLRRIVLEPLSLLSADNKVNISAQVKGGGVAGQAMATRHGIARAFVMIDEENKKLLKKSGVLTRDSRVKERKKPGLKKARRAPQWSKR